MLHHGLFAQSNALGETKGLPPFAIAFQRCYLLNRRSQLNAPDGAITHEFFPYGNDSYVRVMPHRRSVKKRVPRVLYYFWDSWKFVLPAFLLGAVVGYLWWRLQWRKVRQGVGGVGLNSGSAFGIASPPASGPGSASGSASGLTSGSVRGSGNALSSEHVELDNRYQSLVVDRDNQSRAFSALQFELNGLKVALSERDARIASLRAVTTTATSKDQSLNIVKSENDQSENDKSQHEKSEINQAQQEKALLELRTERDRIVSGLRADHEEALAKYRRRAEAAETELQTARGQTNGLQTDMAKLRAEHISVTDRLKADIVAHQGLLFADKLSFKKMHQE